jgi:hypothetical protein
VDFTEESRTLQKKLHDFNKYSVSYRSFQKFLLHHGLLCTEQKQLRVLQPLLEAQVPFCGRDSQHSINPVTLCSLGQKVSVA